MPGTEKEKRGELEGGLATLTPTDEEVHYLWYYYVTASIMVPHVRRRLRRAWGFCERHAWMVLMVEASLRRSFLMGPTVLYNDILGRAASVLHAGGPLRRMRLLVGLHDRGRCLICSMKLKPSQRPYAAVDVIERSRDATPLIDFALSTKEHWDDLVCGSCREDDSPVRCRRHLIEDLWKGTAGDIDEHRKHLALIRRNLAAYGRSFRWENRGTDTPEERASILEAVGWCSGWQPLLKMLPDK